MTTKYVIGQEVEIQNQKGIIKFIGNTEFAPGLWVGIELDSSTGRNDGTINGVKYFDCKPSHGIFVRESFLSIQNQNLKFNFDDEMKKKVEVHGLLLETLHKNSALNQKIEELEEKIKQKGQPGKAFLSEQEKRDEIARLQKEKFLLQREIERFTIEKNILKKNIQQLQDILKAEEPKIVVESNLELWSEISKITKQIDEERVQSQVLENKNNSLMQNIQNARQTAKQQNDELKETLKKKEAYIQKVSESKKNLRDLLSSKGYMRRTSSSTRKIKNKIKQLEAEIRAKKKIVLGIELGKSEHKREMEAVLEVPDEIDRSDWETKVMKRHPEILELRERVKPLHRAVSFSRYYCGAKTEVVDGLTKDVVTQLIMQHYDFYDKKEIRHFIEEKTSIQYQEDKSKLQDSRLLTLLRLGITDAENLWDLVMGSPNTEEMTIEERYDLFQDRADKMGLDFVMENDTPIWEEGPDNPKNITFSHNKEEEDDSKKVDFLSTISAANINKLVEKLTYEKGGDPKFVQAMLMTYQSFMKPEHLLFKLIQRYQVPPYDSERSESEKDWLRTKDVIQLRVASIINLWIQKHPGDFDAKLISKLERFLSQYLKFDKPGMEEKIRAQINKIKEGEDLFIEKGMTFAEQPPEPKVPANIFSKTLKLSDLDEEEFARQVTLFVFSTFRKIQPSELVLQAWSKPKLKHKAPNVLYMASKFNQLVGYICTQIVTPKRVRTRAKRMIRFIKIAEHFYHLNNFDCVMAIIASLSNSSVSRLKFTKNEVPKSYWRIYEELDKATSSENSYKEYRNLLKTVQPPCIPYLGVFLTDLTFISEGSSDKINHDLVNFGKRKLLFETISEIQRFQNAPYNLQKVDQIEKLLKLSLETKSENELYDISKDREPRGAEKSQIVF